MNCKNKRILIFNDGLSLGGTEKLLINLLLDLSKKNEITLLLPEPSGENILLTDVPDSIPVNYLWTNTVSKNRKRIDELNMLFRTKSFLKNHNIKEVEYDLVLCFKDSFYAKIFSRFQIPKILWVHNILYKREYEVRSLRERLAVWLNKKKVYIVEKSYLAYDKIVCVSEACKKSYVEQVCGGNSAAQEVVVVPNAIDVNEVKLLSEEKMMLEFYEDKMNLVLLTRLSPEKRIDRLLAVAERLKGEGLTSFHIHIIGVDTDNRWLLDEIAQKNIADFVSVHGKMKNPYPALAKADWSLCVSERESFSLALLESMSLGTPVITTDCGGPADIVDYGNYGLLVENSEEGIYSGIKKVLGDITLKEKYKKGLSQAVERYSYDGWLEKVNDLLQM